VSEIIEYWPILAVLAGGIAFHARTKLRLEVLEQKVRTLFELINKR